MRINVTKEIIELCQKPKENPLNYTPLEWTCMQIGSPPDDVMSEPQSSGDVIELNILWSRGGRPQKHIVRNKTGAESERKYIQSRNSTKIKPFGVVLDLRLRV